jgi:hypothetical protein
MIKVALFFIYSLFVFSYSNFISDGNNSKYDYIDHIVNTSEDKIYLAIGYKTPDRFLLEIDTSSANVIITELEDIEATFSITTLKFLALKDEHNQYTGNFILAGEYSKLGKIEHFTYTHAAGINRESNISFNQVAIGEVGPILDIVQKDKGGDLYIVSHKNSIWKNILNITTNADTFIAGKNIYERYLDITGKNKINQSYLAQIDKGNVSNIVKEFSYILGPSVGGNATLAAPNTFFTLGFSSNSSEGGITVVGSNPMNNLGSKLTILSINATTLGAAGTAGAKPFHLESPVLLKPKYELIQNQPKGTLVEVGSTVHYGPEYNESNTLQIIKPAGSTHVILPADIPFSMTREGNISKLVQGFYNVTLGSPYNTVINWLDINCSKQVPASKYIIPWSEAQIQALRGTLTNQTENKTDYELCRINDRFAYEQAHNNITLINRQWGSVDNPEDSILWMQDIPNDKIIGNPPRGRIETITTDNTSMVMVTQGDGLIGGINLFKIIDSTTGIIENRIKWHKTYFTGSDVNNSKATVNGPNLLKTIANDFIIAGKIEDSARVNEKKFDCMVVKIDKSGNELWTKNLGGFHDDNCYSVALERNNTSPFYNNYVAVGKSGTRNASGGLDLTSYGVKFRDEGTLLHLAEGWSLIANGTDRNITAQGKKEGSNTIGVTNLGSYKSYFQFIKNQWLINQYPIESLTGFWIYTVNGRQDIFLEGNLLEQKFKDNDLGWVLLGTGIELINAKRKFNLQSLWKFKNGKWIESPTQINSGEGFWAKKKK